MKKRNALKIPLFLAFVPLAAAQPEISQFLPQDAGYRFTLQQETEDPSEAARSLFYSAELLEEVRLQSYSVWAVETPANGAAVLDVIETGESTGAYELFNLWPEFAPPGENRRLDLPVGNLLSERQGVFWRGKFLILVRGSGRGVLEIVFGRLVNDFASSITIENLLPVTVTHLPSEDLVPGSVRFYLGPASLKTNPRFPEPLLKEIGLTERVEVAYGVYGPGDKSLFVIGYPTVALAREYLERLQNGLESFFSTEGIYMKRSGILIGLFVGPEEQAVRVLSRLQYSPSVQWMQEPEPKDRRQETITFFGLVTRAILGTGALLLLILCVGAVAGAVRYSVMKKYPLLFRRDKMVRLQLSDSGGGPPDSP